MDHAADLDPYDLRILEALQHDGRLSNVELGEKVNLSRERVRQIEAESLEELRRLFDPTANCPQENRMGSRASYI